MTSTPPTEAIILLYPSSTQTTKELRNSLSEFCKSHNISIIDIITLTDEYDYLAMRRLSQIIKYNTKHISLVTNRKLSITIAPLTLLSILETLNSPSSFGMVLDFLREFKEDSRASSNNQNPEDFRILRPQELQNISGRMSHMQYSIIRDSRDRGVSPK